MPSWSDLRRYLKNNPGWECFKHTDHDFYRKKLPNGKVLITKVSRESLKEALNNGKTSQSIQS